MSSRHVARPKIFGGAGAKLGEENTIFFGGRVGQSNVFKFCTYICVRNDVQLKLFPGQSKILGWQLPPLLPRGYVPGAVPSLREARGAVPLQTTACAPPFWFIQNTVFGASRNGKTTSNDEKRNNYVQT